LTILYKRDMHCVDHLARISGEQAVPRAAYIISVDLRKLRELLKLTGGSGALAGRRARP